MMERVALSAGRCGSECVEYSIISETEMLPGYKAEFKPKFSSTAMNFKVTFKI